MTREKRKERQRNVRWRVARAGAASVITSLTDISILIALVEVLDLPVAAAGFLAATAGAVTKFVLGKIWVFPGRRAILVGQLVRYMTMVAGSIGLVSATMHLLATVLGLPYLLAKCMSGICVFFLWSYPLQACFVFATSRERSANELDPLP